MDPQEEILRSEHCPDGHDWGANWGLESKDHWGTLTRVGEQPRKVETERGDYRGYYANVRDAIEKTGIAIGTAELTRIPENTVAVSGHTAEQVLKLLEALEDHDDIQSVSANFDISDQELAQISAAS